jgi:hypothetical protein
MIATRTIQFTNWRPSHNCNPPLQAIAAITSERAKVTIWLGDFNRHHLHWDDPADIRLFTRSAIHDAEVLLSAVAELGLNLALPPGTPTHLHNVTKKWTRLDQVLSWKST